MPHGQGICLTAKGTGLIRAPIYSFRNGRVLRRDASDRDRMVWRLIADVRRGRRTRKHPKSKTDVVEPVDSLFAEEHCRQRNICIISEEAAWIMLISIHKKILIILRHHKRLFGMRAGEILQVIDVRKGTLNNVITFPPDGVFFVRSDIDISSLQRVNFKFTSTVLRGSNWEIPLPPFGQGWFENVYMDGDIRVAKGHKRGLLNINVSSSPRDLTGVHGRQNRYVQSVRPRRVELLEILAEGFGL
ncbi:hypothetical protein YC2023_014652 [Brassica napus]